MLVRLRERKLVQWTAAYLAGAWLLLQVAGELRDTFSWPPVVVQVLTVLAGIGFFVAVVLAWYHGEKGQQRVGGLELLMLSALLMSAGGAVTLVGRGQPDSIGRPAFQPGTAMGAIPGVRAGATDRSLAVLPFLNLSRDPDNLYLSEGITEEIRMTLGNLLRFEVVSGQSVMQYRDSRKPVHEIGSELGATHVITGSVQRAGSQLRIIAQLIDAETDRQLWAERYDRPAEDVLSVQSDIARQIAGALEAEFSPVEQARMQRASTNSLPAYEYVLKGREYWARMRPNDNELALTFFQKAVEADPLYADAYVGLSSALRMYHIFRVGSAARMDSAAVAARRAVELDSTSARAHAELGWVLDWQNDFEGALAAHRQALELNPAVLSVAAPGLANVYHYGFGRFDEAARWWRSALEAEPNTPNWHLVAGRTYRDLGMFERAKQHLQRAIALQPDFTFAYEDLSTILALEGQLTQARAQIGTMLAATGEDRHTTGAALGMALRLADTAAARQYYARHVSLGGKPSARAEAQMLMLNGEAARARQVGLADALRAQKPSGDRRRRPGGIPPMATRWALAGEQDAAIHELEAAARAGWRQYYLAKSDPVLRSLQGNPRFDRLMARVKADIDRQRARVEREGW